MTLKTWIILAVCVSALAVLLPIVPSTNTTVEVLSKPIFANTSVNIEHRVLSSKSPFAQLNKANSIKVPILMYHYVEYNHNQEDYLRDSLNIPPHIFEQQVLTLQQAGYTFVTPSQLFEKDAYTIKKPVILSFDDGYADFYTDVYPILKKYKVKAVSYIIFNYIGRQNYMHISEITEISRSGFVEIGSHTLSHSWLTNAPRKTVETELNQSKVNLEKALGKPVTSFAYPYGAFDEATIKIVKDAGYTNAVTTVMGISTLENETYTLKRLRPGYNVGDNLLSIVRY